MKAEDIKVGMKVVATGKTVNPGLWKQFCKDNTFKMGTVTGHYFDDLVVREVVVKVRHPIRDDEQYFFSTRDLATWLEPIQDEGKSAWNRPANFEPKDFSIEDSEMNLKEVKPKKELRSIKPITIQNLVKEGACKDKLQEFIRQVITKSVTYAYEEIPPDLAQSITRHLDEDDWLFNNGFIKYKEVLKVGDMVKCIGNRNNPVVITQDGVMSKRFHDFENPMEILAFIDDLPSRQARHKNNVILRTRKGNIYFADDADLELTTKYFKENDKELKNDDEESDCDE